MLAMSATDSLLPLKLELAERLVAQFSELFVMRGEPTPDCNFCVDLQAAQAARADGGACNVGAVGPLFQTGDFRSDDRETDSKHHR